MPEKMRAMILSKLGPVESNPLKLTEIDKHEITNPKEILVKINPDFYRPAEVEELMGAPSEIHKEIGWTPEGKIDTLVEIPGTVPDGVLFDRQGFIYVSCYRPDRIYRLSPLGELEILADDFEGVLISAPTNIAFCGENLDTLMGTNLCQKHLTQYNISTKGLPLHYPKL